MKKVWAIGDIHGYADLLQNLTTEIFKHFGPEDTLVFLGDYIDRGPDSAGVISQVKLFKENLGSQCIALWGNHEDMAAAALGLPSPCGFSQGMAAGTWRSNGGDITLETCRQMHDYDFAEAFADFIPLLDLFWRDTVETTAKAPGERIFVHAGVPLGKTPEGLAAQLEPDSAWAMTGAESLLWARPQVAEMFDKSRLVVCGHTSSKVPVNNFGFIRIDTGIYKGGPLTALELSEDGSRVFWQADQHGGVTRKPSAF